MYFFGGRPVALLGDLTVFWNSSIIWSTESFYLWELRPSVSWGSMCFSSDWWTFWYLGRIMLLVKFWMVAQGFNSFGVALNCFAIAKGFDVFKASFLVGVGDWNSGDLDREPRGFPLVPFPSPQKSVFSSSKSFWIYGSWLLPSTWLSFKNSLK